LREMCSAARPTKGGGGTKTEGRETPKEILKTALEKEKEKWKA